LADLYEIKPREEGINGEVRKGLMGFLFQKLCRETRAK
jgi:hypothetical protein